MNTVRIARLLAILMLPTALGLGPLPRATAGTLDPAARLLRDASLMLLSEGNARFVAGKPQHPHQEPERRTATAAQGQEPFATILACSDAREPVELIFDRGLGDLLVVRVAGNVAGDNALASVEYGVDQLNTPLLVVLGHTKCDTVTAVVKGTELRGHLHAVAEKIKPATAKAKTETTDAEELLTQAVQNNVWQTIEDLIKQSSILRERISAGRVHVLGAVYDLEQGKVAWLGAHPAQDALVALANQAQTDAVLARTLAAPATPGTPAAATKRGPALPPVARNDLLPEKRNEPAPVWPPAISKDR